LTACNLGLSLAEQGHSVVLVDLDLQFGDLALSLGLTPERTIYDLVTSGGSMDGEKVEGFLATHSSGARVMLAPVRPDQAASITPKFLTELYAVLRERYAFVIVDTPPGFTPEVIATIDASSSVCMVGMLDALSLKNTKLGLETLDLMDYSRDRINLVLNRADTAVGITHNDVVSILGRSPDVLVPSHRDITRSVNDGTPIVLSQKRSEAAKAFHTLAELYSAGRVQAKPKRPGRSLLGRSRA
jgi:pilus assembly protein CpaE